jgi:hypothetical protein
MLEDAKVLGDAIHDNKSFTEIGKLFTVIVDKLNIELESYDEGTHPVSLLMIRNMVKTFDDGMEASKSKQFVTYAVISMTTAIKIYEMEQDERSLGRN